MIPPHEVELLKQVRQHIANEKQIHTYATQGQNDDAINLLLENNKLEDEILKCISDPIFLTPLQIRDDKTLKRLQLIKNKITFTKDFINFYKKHGFIVTEEISEEEWQQKLRDTLYEMQDYFFDIVQVDSVTFSEKKIKFSTIITKKPLPNIVNVFLDDIKNCYLLNMNAPVIALCRVLLEASCKKIYESTSIKKKLRYMDEEKETYTNIVRIACKHKHFTENEIEKTKELYKISSKILHGKIEKYPDADETLNFARDTFSIIEKLYSDDYPKR